jgi:hypothetical protein
MEIIDMGEQIAAQRGFGCVNMVMGAVTFSEWRLTNSGKPRLTREESFEHVLKSIKPLGSIV